MAILLGIRQYQGLSSALSQMADDPSELLRVPEDACWPAHIAVDNPHATAIVYLKWVQIGANSRVASDDYSRRLKAGEGYVWDQPPRNCKLLAITDTGSVKVSLDTNWSYLNAVEPI